MPSAEQIRLFRSVRKVKTPQISCYEIIRDTSFVGYKNKITWKYNDVNIIGFRVWRAVSKKVLLRKKYIIPQIALERLTGLKSFHSRNTALYNKQFFSQHSMLEFDLPTGSDRFIKRDEESEIDFHRFTEVGFVRKNRKQSYKFVDKRVKFGETYLYVISAITTSFFESEKSRPVTVRVEDLEHPDSPEDVKLFLGSNSIVVTIGTSVKANDVMAFDIHRREEHEKEFKKIAQTRADELEFINFLDFNVIPGKVYYYKVYSRDFYGNLSFSAKEHKISYDSGFVRKGDVPPPEVSFEVDGNQMIVRGKKNHPNIIGYRVERKDSWRFEQEFEIKNFIGIPWPNVNMFDASGSIEFIDKTTVSGNIYQYRVSSIKSNGIPATFLITPHIRIQDKFIFPKSKKKDVNKKSTNLVDFSTQIADAKQCPIFTKFSWKIEGDWSYMILEITRGVSHDGAEILKPETIKLKIDNIHEDNSVYYTQLEKGNSYQIKAKVFDFDDKLLDEANNQQITRIAI